MKEIKLDIKKFGGRGASSLGGSTKSGKLRRKLSSKHYEQLDVSALSGFPVKLKDEFENYMDMKSYEVENGYLMDKDGKVVAGARGDKHSVGVAYSGSQEGFTLTHNHPSGYGGTFSGPDIAHLTEGKLKSIRAVAREGTYSMTAKKGANYDGLNRALAKEMNKLNQRGAKKGLSAQNKGKSKNEVRKAYVDVLHDWYKKNASKYGFTYSFKPNKDYDIKARRKLRKV